MMSILALVKRKRSERELCELSEQSHAIGKEAVFSSTYAWDCSLNSLNSLNSQLHDRPGSPVGRLPLTASMGEEWIVARRLSKRRPKVAVLPADAAHSEVRALIAAGWQVLRVIEGAKRRGHGDDATV